MARAAGHRRTVLGLRQPGTASGVVGERRVYGAGQLGEADEARACLGCAKRQTADRGDVFPPIHVPAELCNRHARHGHLPTRDPTITQELVPRGPSSRKVRCPLVPSRGSLVGMTDPQDRFLVERFADDLHSDGQTRGREAAAHAQGGQPGLIERDGAQREQVPAVVRKPHLPAVDAGVALAPDPRWPEREKRWWAPPLPGRARRLARIPHRRGAGPRCAVLTALPGINSEPMRFFSIPGL